jgi:hypothetical protein
VVLQNQKSPLDLQRVRTLASLCTGNDRKKLHLLFVVVHTIVFVGAGLFLPCGEAGSGLWVIECLVGLCEGPETNCTCVFLLC